MIIEWKHRRAEAQVEPLLDSAARLDPDLVQRFPRRIKDIVCASLPVAFESYRGLRAATVVQILGDAYGVDHRELLADADGPLAGYTFARGNTAVIFSDSQYGEGFELFTLAHEAAHVAVEYLPILARSQQAELFGGPSGPVYFARRDPPSHIFVGNAAAAPGPSDLRADYARLRADRDAWLREVIANACAAELLAPHREVGRLMSSLAAGTSCALALQTHFGLSRRAAEVRLTDLGLAQGSGLSFSLLE